MKDSNGKNIKDGDKIKTERGVELDIVEKDGELYMKNSGNGQISHLDILNIPFYRLN